MARYTDVDALMKNLGIADSCEKCQFGCGAFCTKDADFVDACDAICEAPIADVVERKVGKWKHDADGLVWCYECGFGKERSDERPYRYCPNCGADMRERSENAGQL